MLLTNHKSFASKEIFGINLYFIQLQLANKSLQFYKGSLAALHKPDKSDFLPVPQSGKDEKIEKGEEKTLHGDEDLNSPLTFRDFCKYSSNILWTPYI